MSVHYAIPALLTALHENSMKIGALQERVESNRVYLNGLRIPLMSAVTMEFSDLYLERYNLQADLAKAYEVKHQTKTRFQRLFNK